MRELKGLGVSEGAAVGPAFVHETRRSQVGRKFIPETAVEAEIERFQRAVGEARDDLVEAEGRLREAGDEERADILDFHLQMADDPELAVEVEERVRDLESPESAVLAVGDKYAEPLANSEDEYMAARADDVRDVVRRIAAGITGEGTASLNALQEPSVIVARNLAPSETAQLPRSMALGFVTAEGSLTSHVSIMARSMGIPAVVGLGPDIEAALEARTVAVDGGEGRVIADPDPETVAVFENMRSRREEERAALDEYRHIEARTRDGRRIEVAANLGSASEAEEALGWGAEGVGLFRTEFLFMERDELPSEEEQYQAYSAVARAFGTRPVILRTLDVGGSRACPALINRQRITPFSAGGASA